MKYKKLLCEKCREKIKKEWKKEKQVYRLKVKEAESKAEEVPIKIKKYEN